MNELKYVKQNDKKLNTRDLVMLGMYTLLLILLMGVGVGVAAGIFSVLFSGKFYFAVFKTVTIALFAAPAFTLIFNKINKNNAILLMTIIIALFLVVSGHVAILFPVAVVAGIIAEYFYRKGNEYISYISFSLGNIGATLPIFLMKDMYLERMKSKGYSQEKIDFVMQSSSINILLVVILLTILFSIVGTYISRKFYFKNFEKAQL